MAFKLTNCKEVALRAFINEWLKEDTLYCNYCGNIFQEDGVACCDKPQIGTNAYLTSELIKENKRIRDTRLNDYASNKDMTMRLGISITPRLLHDLEEYSINTLKEPLWKDRAEMDDFMRSFPEFTVCRKV